MSFFHTRAALLLIGLIAAQAAMAHNSPSASAHAALRATQQATLQDTSAPADDGLTGVDHIPGTTPLPLPKPKAR
jgi:hypothetical protein